MAYVANQSNKEINDLETAAEHSGIRLFQDGQTVILPAYDLQQNKTYNNNTKILGNMIGGWKSGSWG